MDIIETIIATVMIIALLFVLIGAITTMRDCVDVNGWIEIFMGLIVMKIVSATKSK
ncbi:hypothetical protein [Saccharolobus islandicus]|uniref:hypothetical protein n=1 Tax=Saccharolobus islandicus TaxID=43080 RepID=UPI0003823910|nr:hypothetical protein [Sulfolobus islandicus]